MEEKQAQVVQPPPPYTAQPGYPPQQAHQPQGQPGYQPQPAYPPQGQPGYQPQPGYSPQKQAGYPPQPGYPPQGQAGYPPQPGYPPQGQAGYPPQAYAPPPQQIIAPVQQVSTNVTVVTGGAPTVVAHVLPPDNCGLAWFACLCCFWPLGICAIISANETREAIDRGDLAAANHSSMMARRYANLSIGLGILCFIVLIIIVTTAR